MFCRARCFVAHHAGKNIIVFFVFYRVLFSCDLDVVR